MNYLLSFLVSDVLSDLIGILFIKISSTDQLVIGIREKLSRLGIVKVIEKLNVALWAKVNYFVGGVVLD
jgi:hypothetical protein